MLVARLQRLLETIYNVRTLHDVLDFLVTEPETLERLHDTNSTAVNKESLLVSQTADTLDVALYLDRALLDHLDDNNPFELLHDENLGEFWVALEGVSHFVYLTWRAGADQDVSRLELELQAEVDKYVVTLFLLRRQGRGQAVRMLHEWLFERTGFDDKLELNALARYVLASRYASKYCRGLQERFLRQKRSRGLMTELRNFYRLSQAAKIRHSDRSVYAS